MSDRYLARDSRIKYQKLFRDDLMPVRTVVFFFYFRASCFVKLQRRMRMEWIYKTIATTIPPAVFIGVQIFRYRVNRVNSIRLLWFYLSFSQLTGWDLLTERINQARCLITDVIYELPIQIWWIFIFWTKPTDFGWIKSKGDWKFCKKIIPTR